MEGVSVRPWFDIYLIFKVEAVEQSQNSSTEELHCLKTFQCWSGINGLRRGIRGTGTLLMITEEHVPV